MSVLTKQATVHKAQQGLPRHSLWWIVNLGCALWAMRTLWLVAQAPAHGGILLFTTTDLQYLVLTTGYSALVILCLSLACTPLALITGWNQIASVRKSLGLWGFAFATFHALTFLGGTRFFNNRESWITIWSFAQDAWSPEQWGKVPYGWAGALALSALIPLAITSNRWAMRKLGKNWKRLHRLVYVAVPLAVWHYWWRETFTRYEMLDYKVDFRDVYTFAAVVLLLLLLRLPWLRSIIRHK